jgi:hypothetical protein
MLGAASLPWPLKCTKSACVVRLSPMGKKKATTASQQTAEEKEQELQLKREAFFQYYTKNQEMFGNATRSYAEAFIYKLDELSRQPRYEGKGKKRKKLPSEYDLACNVCAVEGGRLLRIPQIQEHITALLNELLRDDIGIVSSPRSSRKTTTSNRMSGPSTSTTRSAAVSSTIPRM